MSFCLTLIRGSSFIPPYSLPKVPFRWGGTLPQLLQITVYETHTHIYSQAIHVPDGGWGMAIHAGPGQTGQCETNHKPAKTPCALVRFAAHVMSQWYNAKHRAKTCQQSRLHGQLTCTTVSLGIFKAQYTHVVHHGELVYTPFVGSAERHQPRRRRAERPDQN